MYGTLYTSSEYYEDISPTTNNVCLICWMPSQFNNPVKCIKENSYILSDCQCNALFHNNCLNQWIDKTSSCPICRKFVTINKINCIAYIFVLLNTVVIVLQLILFVYLINFIYLSI